jgi:protein TonB
LVQSVAVVILVLIPLIYTEALPRQKMLSFLLAPPAPPPPRTAAPPRTVVVNLKPQPQQPMVQPDVMPDHPAIIHDAPLPPSPFVGFVNDAVQVSNDTSGIFPRDVIVTPPPPPSPAVSQEPLRMAPSIVAAKLINQPKPVYPPMAIQTRTQGTVRLEAIIDKDGAIKNLMVLSGHPLLVPAALAAVRQWRYQPTMLNRVPVEVETTIDVNFVLGA